MRASDELNLHTMKFDGALLKRGFWLYVWKISNATTHYLYIGRTGDSSSPYAQSPFNRIGQHLDLSPNAKSNSLGRQLLSKGINHGLCTFEMIAIGPIFNEQSTFDEHKPKRNMMAALERETADYFKNKGYVVLGNHPKKASIDTRLWDQVRTILDSRLPTIG